MRSRFVFAAMRAVDAAPEPRCEVAVARAARLAGSSVRGIPKTKPNSAPADAAAAAIRRSAPKKAVKLTLATALVPCAQRAIAPRPATPNATTVQAIRKLEANILFS